jgi:hypothetical protein
MKHDLWEFLKKPDGTYYVAHNAKLLSDSISGICLATQICEEYGFCGRESEYICTELGRSGVCTVDLSASDPFHSSDGE